VSEEISNISEEKLNQILSTSNTDIYPGDYIDESGPLRDNQWQTIDYPNAAIFLAFYNKSIREGEVLLHPWQIDFHEKAAAAPANSQEPYKECLLTCNGSGKDAFIIAGWSCWFVLAKIKARVIITSSSGVQLTAQTENYIRSLAQSVNDYHQCEIFRIRQRYIKCMLSGSEIRMFATDEAGKAEGYHPLEPNAEMTIIVNEAKSVSPEIFGALKRCTGFNYWFNISSAGEPFGDFYNSFTSWTHTRRITAFDCPHISRSEIEEARRDLGENSALFRSIYLALFTSLSNETVIPKELVEQILKSQTLNPPERIHLKNDRIGLDLAAGGDENTIYFCNGNKCLKEVCFREVDTEIAADRIDLEFRKFGLPKDYKYIFADDGGVGHAIIDKLRRKGWININRVNNQSAAISKKLYGNKGAENWIRFSRIVEERFFDLTTVSTKCHEQLYSRHYKKTNTSGRLFLESKKEAKAEGRPSPDRADGLVLAYTGVSLDDFTADGVVKEKPDNRPKERFDDMESYYEHYENNVVYEKYDHKKKALGARKVFASLQVAMKNHE